MAHAVIFDIDGTLLDSFEGDDRIYRESVRQVLGDVWLRGGASDYDTITDTGILQQILDDNELTVDDDAVRAIKNTFFSGLGSYLDSSGPFTEIPGARAVLKRIAALDDHHLAIATGGWRQSAEMKLRSAAFDIDGIPLATSDDATERTAIMQFALDALGGSFESVTYFGDGHWDRRACKELNWTFQAVGEGLDGLRSFDGLYAD